MEVLAAIDNILKLLPVRWGLLIATVALAVACLVQKGDLYITGLELKAAEGRSEKLTASLSMQNAAVKKAGENMEAAKKRLEVANNKAAELKRRLAERKVEIREVVLQGECPDMVQQVLDEVRK